MHIVNSALEAEYNNRLLVSDHPAIFEPWRRDSASFVDSTPCTLDIACGIELRRKLDIFHATNPRGTIVFIHGGN